MKEEAEEEEKKTARETTMFIIQTQTPYNIFTIYAVNVTMRMFTLLEHILR